MLEDSPDTCWQSLAVYLPPSDGPVPSAPRVFLVDDDERLRLVIHDLLEDEGIMVIGEAGDADEALALLPVLATTFPVVALIDVRMPGRANGLQLTRLLSQTVPSVRVIVFAGFPKASIEQAAREADAVAVLLKDSRADSLIAAVRQTWKVMLEDR